MQLTLRKEVIKMDKFQEIKERILKETQFVVVPYSDFSIGVFRKNKLTRKSEEIAWIRRENGKIVVIFPPNEQKFIKSLGFSNVREASFTHLAAEMQEDAAGLLPKQEVQEQKTGA